MPVPPPVKGKPVAPVEKERITRQQKQLDDGKEITMPPLADEFDYLIETLLEAGPSSAAGMGPVPLTWADLAAWQQGTGIELTPWEARLMRRLSAEYLNESQRAETRDAPPPWQPEMTQELREKVASNLKNLLRS